MATLYLCAAGNPEGVRLAIEVNEAAPRWERIVLLDDAPEKQGRDYFGVKVIGGFGELAHHQPGDEAVNLVARSTKGRDGARAKIESFGLPLVSLIHPSINTRFSTIGKAVTIYEGCTVSAMSTVGDHAVIFTQAVLGHGATLGRGAVLAPGAVVNARVQVGDRGYVGANATVLPDLTIGTEATVSACSAAVGNVPDGATALGVPAEVMGGAAEPVGAAPAGEGADPDAVRAVFAEVLGLPGLAADANFFDSGGNSKKAMELQAALKAALGTPVSVVDLFRYPRPDQLAAHLSGGAPAARPTRAELRRRRQARK